MLIDSFAQAPLPLGENKPYEIRGLLLQATMGMASKMVPGGTMALKAQLLDPERAYLGQRFGTLTWYDAYSLVALNLAMAQLRHVSLSQQAQDFGAFSCAHDARSGPHAMLLKLLKPHQMASFMPRIANFCMRIFDKVTSDVVVGEAKITAHGLPAMPGEFMFVESVAYAAEFVRIAGGKNVHFRFLPSDKVSSVLINANAVLTWS